MTIVVGFLVVWFVDMHKRESERYPEQCRGAKELGCKSYAIAVAPVGGSDAIAEHPTGNLRAVSKPTGYGPSAMARGEITHRSTPGAMTVM